MDGIDDQGHPVRPCLQCREPLTFPTQPGDAVCAACGVAQYLTQASSLWPNGGQGRYPSDKGPRPA